MDHFLGHETSSKNSQELSFSHHNGMKLEIKNGKNIDMETKHATKNRSMKTSKRKSENSRHVKTHTAFSKVYGMRQAQV